MDEAIDTLKFLASNPQLTIPLVVLLLVWPIAKRAGTAFDERVGHLFPKLSNSQAAVFILLVHLLLTIIASVVCYGLSDVNPVSFRPHAAKVFGVQTERFMGFMISVFFAFVNMLGVWAISLDGHPATRLARDMLGARMAIFGLVGAVSVTAYSALFDPSLVEPIPEFPNGFIAGAWWYTTLPITSIVLTASGYILSQIFRLLWFIAGKLSLASQE